MFEVKYFKRSLRKRHLGTRLQLIASGFTLFIMLTEPSKNPSTVMTTLKILAAFLGLIHLLGGLKYEKAKSLLGNHFEMTLYFLSGLIIILGGIILKLEGSHTVYFIQILLGLFYILALPKIAKKAMHKNTLQIRQDEIRYSKPFKNIINLSWKKIISIELDEKHLQVKTKDRNKVLHFYLIDSIDNNLELINLIEKMQG